MKALAIGLAALAVALGLAGSAKSRERSAIAPNSRSATAATIKEYALPATPAWPFRIARGANSLYFTEHQGRVGEISTVGAIKQWVLPAGSEPLGVVSDADGNVWFTERGTRMIGRLQPGSGTLTHYPLPGTSKPSGIDIGPDNSIWFTESDGPGIGRLERSSGAITEFAAPTPGSQPQDIAPGPDGALWFTQKTTIGRVGFLGEITEFGPVPGTTSQNRVQSITRGPDDRLWMTVTGTTKNMIVRLEANGAFTVVAADLPTPAANPFSITRGPDGALWFIEAAVAKIGRITIDGLVSEYASFTADTHLDSITLGPDDALWYTKTEPAGAIGRFTPGDPPVRMQMVLRSLKPCPEGLSAAICYFLRVVQGSSGSWSADAQVRVPGDRTYRLPTVRSTSRANRAVTLRRGLPRAVGFAVERSLRRGGRPTLTLTITGRDRRGNSHMVRGTLTIRR